MPLPVFSPDMCAGVAFVTEISNQSTTRTKIDLSTTPAKSITIQAISLESSTVKRLFIVADAVSNSEAATKISLAGQRLTMQMGDTMTVAFNIPVSRLDIVSDVAETGTSVIVVTAVVAA